MSTDLCGHDRDALIWALNLWATISNGGVVVYSAGTGSGKVAKTNAFGDVNDPTKVAEMLAARGRELGFDICHQWDGSQRNEFLVYYEPDRGPMLVIDHLGGILGVKNTLDRLFPRKAIDLPHARAILLQWLQLPNGAREEALKVLRGEP